MDEKLLSIIVPVYNVEEYLDRCMNSLINQTYRNKEIILVDDGSTDGSGNLCDEYSERYPFVHVIHKKNGWQGEARNFGLESCKGDYVSFVDPDDWIELDGCEKLIKALEETKSDFVIGEFITEFDDKSLPPRDLRSFEMDGHQAAYLNLNKNYICSNSSCNKLYVRDFIGDLRFPVGKKFEDTFFIQEAILKAKKVYKTGIPFYHHYQRAGSTTHHTFMDWHFHLVEAYEIFHGEIAWKYPDMVPYSEARLLQVSIDYINGALSSRNPVFKDKILHCQNIVKKIPVHTRPAVDEVGDMRTRLQHILLKTSLFLYVWMYRVKNWKNN